MQCKRPQFDSWVEKPPWRRDRLPTSVFLGFPGGSDGKESACNVGDLGLIPKLGRSPWGGDGNLLQYSYLENACGQGSLAGYSPWDCKEHDTAEWLSTAQFIYNTVLVSVVQKNESVNIHPLLFRLFSYICHYRVLSRLPCAILLLLFDRWVVSDSATPWIVAHQASLSMGFLRQEYWSGLPFPSSGDLPYPEIEPTSPARQGDSSPLSQLGSPLCYTVSSYHLSISYIVMCICQITISQFIPLFKNKIIY